MIKIPESPNYFNNLKKCGDHLPCAICGKAVKSPKAKYIRVFWGSHAVTEQEAEEIIAREGEGGDCCGYPIGPDCLKRHPEMLPYAK